MISTLLYAVDCWRLYRSHVKKLYAFMMRHLGSILNLMWKDMVTNKEIMNRTGLPPMEDLLVWKNLRWTGHLIPHEDATQTF